MNRYRWYRLQVPGDEKHLSELESRFPFGDLVDCGFVGGDSVDGREGVRFLWRRRMTISAVDAQGIPESIEVDCIDHTDFYLTSLAGWALLRVENPGRHCGRLLSFLESVVGFGFTSRLILFDHVRPNIALDKFQSVALVGLKVSGAVVGEDLVGRLEFASKRGMVEEKMGLLRRLKYKVEQSTYNISYQGISGQISVTAGGTVKISGQLAPALLGLVEQEVKRIALTS